MNHPKWRSVFLVSLVVLLLGFITGKLLSETKTFNQTSSQSVIHAQSTTPSPSEKNTIHLQASSELRPQSSTSAIPATLNTSEIHSRRNITLEADLERIKEIYAKNPHFNLNQENDKTFLAQPLNSDWALPREAKLSEIISQDKDLHNLNLKAISCRSSHCRIQIYYQSEDELHSIPDQVSKSMTSKIDQMLIPTPSADFDRTDKILNIYLTDDPEASLLK